jgi:hypothetical protein
MRTRIHFDFDVVNVHCSFGENSQFAEEHRNSSSRSRSRTFVDLCGKTDSRGETEWHTDLDRIETLEVIDEIGSDGMALGKWLSGRVH